MSWSGRRRSWPWVILFVGILLVGLFYVGLGWYFSNVVYEDGLKAEPYDPIGQQTGSIASVTLDESGDAVITLNPDAEFAGDRKFDASVVGVAVGESLVVLGPQETTGGTAPRPVLEVNGALPAAGDRYGMTRDVWLTPEQAGLDADDVSFRTLEGQKFAAWRVRAKQSQRWAILTHGKGAPRSEMLRMGRPLHEAGYNLLIITYTNDEGAPASEDGMVHYGRSEWKDLEGAVQYALDREASQILLGGASHGGAVTLGFLAQSPLARRVDALILDAPVSNFGEVIDEQAEFKTLPGGLAIPESLEDVAMWLVAARFGVSYSAVDYAGAAGLIQVPLLTFQGDADRTVPRVVNDHFMRTGSGQGGTYAVEEGADHLLSWNEDPEAYEERIATFLEQLG